jgi:phage I-like protein
MVAPSHHAKRQADPLTFVRGGLSGIKELAAQQAVEASKLLREAGQDAITKQKQRAAQELSSVSAAIRRAAEKLEDQKSGTFVSYFESAAQTIDNAARYVEERELAEVAEDLGNFTRKRPALVLGGLLVAGLAAGRFLNASNAAAGRSRGRRR